jgi:EAL domain-containing protein (putative c-di-GMP-specific phosphodiesterase class I)
VGLNEGRGAIVSGIISLSHMLGLQVVAEGVDSQPQLDFLRQQGCDRIQGFLLSKPLSAEDFAGLLKAGGGAVSAAMTTPDQAATPATSHAKPDPGKDP